ncbi:hypothetical protein [Arthrobacter bambusae]|uniref:hypothetical protein n=1 Tax=Arthrobacter bambusae TaxID=1338426 RepID=UPI00277F52B6|nr:hypothetical protein [Arthrobacter bambusae]MDQ0030855.1 hypothetical protein [Arthrobacter bambusae]MDQ0099220.1 hypothetical protein [Arthrobacter bambusae]
MGNSGKLAIISAVVSAGLLVLLASTLDETVMYIFLGVVALGYLACVAEVFARRRYFMLVLGAIASILFIAFGIAFLRMWGLAFNQDENALGSAVSTKDSDIYFYLAAAAGCSSLLVLFIGAVWPSRRSRAKVAVRPAARRPSPRPAPRPSSAPARPAQRLAARPASGAVKRPAPRKPTPAPAAPAKRPTSGSPKPGAPAQRKPASKR